jgi:hypothetical protein
MTQANVTFSRYLHNETERRSHLRKLNAAIDKILPCRISVRTFPRFVRPWLEDTWFGMRRSPVSAFGFFVPLFVPWLRFWGVCVNSRGLRVYLRGLRSIFNLLSPDFLYVTVCQNGNGIESSDIPVPIPSNLFILSQGGKGHVPLLLWRDQLDPKDFPVPRDYQFSVLFMGSTETHVIRTQMIKIIQKVMPNTSYFSSSRRIWTSQYEKAKVILCPRGFGRNSYRLGEVLQMGMVPFYVYNDLIWLPYYDSINWSSIGFIAHIDEFETVLQRLKTELTIERISSMRAKVRSLYPTHWTGEAVIRQILNLLKSGFGGSDLRCGKYLKWRG